VEELFADEDVVCLGKARREKESRREEEVSRDEGSLRGCGGRSGGMGNFAGSCCRLGGVESVGCCFRTCAYVDTKGTENCTIYYLFPLLTNVL